MPRANLRYTHAVPSTSCLSQTIRSVLLALSFVAWLSPASAAAPQTGTATEFYMSYRAAFDKAQKIEELFPYLAAKNRQEAEKTPADERVKLFELMKMFGEMKDVKVVKAAKNGSGETLSVEGTVDGKKQTCAVQIVNEGGAWKLGAEKCSGSF
jgi:hypothetical protein